MIIVSPTGRWHAIQARRMKIHKELRGRVHSFLVSVIPIRCGVFEFTARTRTPKAGNKSWVWANLSGKNERIHIMRASFQQLHLTQGAVRQLATWFDDILGKRQILEMDCISNPSKTSQDIVVAYRFSVFPLSFIDILLYCFL